MIRFSMTCTLILGSVSCRPAGNADEQGAPQVGAWEAVFGQDDSLPVVGNREVRGLIALFPDSRRRRRMGLTGPPTSTEGVFALNFAPFGFEVDSALGSTAALSRREGDSVFVTLNPFVSSGSVEIRAVLRADSLIGRWFLTSSLRRGAGSVVLVPAR